MAARLITNYKFAFHLSNLSRFYKQAMRALAEEFQRLRLNYHLLSTRHGLSELTNTGLINLRGRKREREKIKRGLAATSIESTTTTPK